MALKNFAHIYFMTVIVSNIQFVKSILPPSSKVSSSEAPFVVHIQCIDEQCTGVIINSLIILTAGHCIHEHNIIVTAGRSEKYYSNNTQTVRVKESLMHENYLLHPNGIQSHYDIGLLLLDTPLTFNLFVQPIEWTNNIDFNKSVSIYGWGSTGTFPRSPSDYLRVKNVSLIPDKLCEDMLKNAYTKCTKQVYEICTQKGPCHGDSGGPAIHIVDNVKKLIGILSWGADDNINCDSSPAVYVNVGYFSEWIKDGIRVLMKGNITENLTGIENTV